MAKIIKIGSHNTTLTSKTANLSKTSRQGNSTNPFKFSNFEGNTLQFADVFEGFEPKKQNKLRMIASSVTGSMNKMRNSITEPIKNFVNRVRSGISTAWDYATNTNVSELPGIKQINELPGVKQFNDVMNTPIHINDIPGIKQFNDAMNTPIHIGNLKNIGKNISDNISSKMDFLNSDVKDLWSGMVSKINTNKYSSDMTVGDLEQAWKNEIANESMEGVA